MGSDYPHLHFPNFSRRDIIPFSCLRRLPMCRMSRRTMHHAALAAIVAAAPFVCLVQDQAQSPVTESGQIKLVDPRTQSSLALSDPATFAWRLFVFINW